jgi:LCP family protein required for cell wall assembly
MRTEALNPPADGEVSMTQRPSGNSGGKKAGRGRRITRWVAAVVAAVLVVGVLVAYEKYRGVWDSIHRVTIGDLGKRPPKYTNAVNLLVFGDDSRGGLTLRQQRMLHVGRNQGENNTDTIMIVHISPGRHLVTVMSIPRDTVVPVYSCAKGPSWPGQQPSPGGTERINSVFAAGGPSCLWKTVEQQTGIRLDHFVELGFGGFVHVINDMGGVNVCVPFTVRNWRSGLRLTKGQHRVNGTTALAFWRTRENIGTGSDLQRIQRDQFLMSQLFKGVLHSRLLSSPSKLLSVISDAAKAMTTDEGLSQTDILHIAQSLRGLSGKEVQFLTAPNKTDPANLAEVEFEQPRARQMFEAIAHDKTLPKPSRHKAAGHGHHPPVLAAKPSQVYVEVLNGSGVAGQAGQAASALTHRGFHVTGTGDAPRFSHRASVISYSQSSQLPQVRALAKQIPGARIKQVPGLRLGTIDLITGSSYHALRPQPAPSPSAHASVASLSHRYGGITGGTSCKSDSGAFAGPLSP